VEPTRYSIPLLRMQLASTFTRKCPHGSRHILLQRMHVHAPKGHRIECESGGSLEKLARTCESPHAASARGTEHGSTPLPVERTVEVSARNSMALCCWRGGGETVPVPLVAGEVESN